MSSSPIREIGPSALVVEGEAGIGKTTVWLAALEQAGPGFACVDSCDVGRVGARLYVAGRAA